MAVSDCSRQFENPISDSQIVYVNECYEILACDEVEAEVED